MNFLCVKSWVTVPNQTCKKIARDLIKRAKKLLQTFFRSILNIFVLQRTSNCMQRNCNSHFTIPKKKMHAVCYIGAMVQIETCFFGIIHCIIKGHFVWQS